MCPATNTASRPPTASVIRAYQASSPPGTFTPTSAGTSSASFPNSSGGTCVFAYGGLYSTSGTPSATAAMRSTTASTSSGARGSQSGSTTWIAPGRSAAARAIRSSDSWPLGWLAPSWNGTPAAVHRCATSVCSRSYSASVSVWNSAAVPLV